LKKQWHQIGLLLEIVQSAETSSTTLDGFYRVGYNESTINSKISSFQQFH